MTALGPDDRPYVPTEATFNEETRRYEMPTGTVRSGRVHDLEYRRPGMGVRCVGGGVRRRSAGYGREQP